MISLLLAVPAAVGLWLVTGGRDLSVHVARVTAVVAALTTALLALIVSVTRPGVDRAWLPELGVRWSFGVDDIAIPLVLLTAVIGVLVVAHAWVDLPAGGSPAAFLGCLLLVEAGALATFTARDAVLFFVAFELVLVPMWVLISRYGDRHDEAARVDAGHRFVLYTALGSTLMLVGILTLVTSAGTSSLAELATGAGESLSADRQLLVAALLVGGLAVKVPVFPLHTWLPPAHTTAPTAGSVLLAGGAAQDGHLRPGPAARGERARRLRPARPGARGASASSASSGVASSASSSATSSGSSPTPRSPTWASSSSRWPRGRRRGLQAALFANIAHGVISALLFFLVGGLKQRWGSVDLTVARPALRETSPRLGFLLVLGLAASLGLPGLAGFWGEFFAVYAAWLPAEDRPRGLFVACAVAAAIGAALAAAYALRVARIVWVGDALEEGQRITPDASGTELGILGVLAASVIVLGVFPGPLLDLMAGAVAQIVGSP